LGKLKRLTLGVLSGPTRLGDLLASALAVPARDHGQLLGDLPVTEDLDRLLIVGDQALLDQGGLVNRRAVVELVEVRQVHDVETAFEVVVAEPALGDPAEQRRLAAFRAGLPVGAAAARRSALAAAAGRLAAPAAFAAPTALRPLVAGGLGGQFVDH